MHDPRVPETLEGWALLHQMFLVRWETWRALPKADRRARATESADALAAMNRGDKGVTALSTLIGHKADLMLVHFRPGFEEAQAAELDVSQLPIWPYLQPATSYESRYRWFLPSVSNVSVGRSVNALSSPEQLSRTSTWVAVEYV